MIPALTTGLTFARSFPGPVAITAVLALVVGAALSWFVTRAWYVSDVASLRVELADMRTAIATKSAERVAQGASEVVAAQRELSAHVDRIAAALAAVGPQIRAAGASIATAQQELSRDARYACRRVPLPDDYLDRMRLPPAGSAP